MSQPADSTPEMDLSMLPPEEVAPRHGYQGNRGAAPRSRGAPLGLAVAVSREAGARGGTIARRAAARLGWQVYDQELLEYMSQDSIARQGLLDALPPAYLEWVESRMRVLEQGGALDDPAVLNLARLVLALGAQGEVVLLGRGAGCILPRRTTLHVRVVAPVGERISYMGQWLRLSAAEASERVRSRDEHRAEFIKAHFGRHPGDVHQYDLVLNSSLLGEEACADLIAQAARARSAAFIEQTREG